MRQSANLITHNKASSLLNQSYLFCEDMSFEDAMSENNNSKDNNPADASNISAK